MTAEKLEILSRLKKEILSWQGYKRPLAREGIAGLGEIEKSFPNQNFPTGCLHEFVCPEAEGLVSTCGFISGLIHALAKESGVALWITAKPMIYPPALAGFGIKPENILFLYTEKAIDAAWATEEALKCDALSSVVAELNDLNIIQFRRLQLAAEQSRVTGFLMRTKADQGKVAGNPGLGFAARWKISPLPSLPIKDLPGTGLPHWRIELLKVRNGLTGVWDLEWKNHEFVFHSNAGLTSGKQEIKLYKAG